MSISFRCHINLITEDIVVVVVVVVVAAAAIIIIIIIIIIIVETATAKQHIFFRPLILSFHSLL